MFHIPDLHIDGHQEEIGLPERDPQIVDIGLELSDQRADGAQRARLIGQRQVDPRHIACVVAGIGRPAQVVPAFQIVLELGQQRTGNHMHHHAPAPPQPHNPVARNRPAAGAELDIGAPAQATHRDQRRRRSGLVAIASGPRQQARCLAAILLAARVDRFHNLTPGHLALGQIGQHQLDRRIAQLRRRRTQRLAPAVAFGRGKGLIGEIMTQIHQFGALAVAQRAPDRGFGSAGLGHVLPMGRGALTLGGDDLDLLPVSQTRPQRHPPPVDKGTGALIADDGVDRVGKIDWRRTTWQAHHVALGREAENLVGEHIQFDMLQEFMRLVALLEPRHQIAQPGKRIDRERILHPLAVLIGPMGGNAGLGHLVHLVGADLHLDPHRANAVDSRVNRPVAVGLGSRDVVLEPPRHQPPAAMNRPQRPVAILLGVDQNPEAVNVRKLREAGLLLLHLAPDRVGALLATLDLVC